MASYQELKGLVQDGPLREKIQIAIMDVAYDVFQETTPVAARVTWANAALESPESTERKLMSYVLIANKAATVATIHAADDPAIKTNIEDAVAKTVAAAA